MKKIAYLVHDLNDPAVARRVRMFRAAGDDVVVIGFCRTVPVPVAVAGAPAVHLGRTADARLVQRAAAVLRNLLMPGRMLAAAAGSDVVVGRNLEALALARRVRAALPGARLVYECLDIHRSLLGRGPADRAIQAAEAALLRAVDLLIVSSPAFLREHFSTRPTLSAPALLVENKLLALDGEAPVPPAPPPAGPPWTIGWFGNLRCRRSFAVLSDLARRHQGRVAIRIAGRASPAEFPDFAGQIAAAPHVSHAGAYTAADLPALYGGCHFAWAIDYFEEGLNSRWLLPNRLYEASSFGAVPIALRSVETGRWLERRGAGLLVDDDPAAVGGLFDRLDGAAYAALHAAVAAIPRSDLVAGRSDCAMLSAAVHGA